MCFFALLKIKTSRGLRQTFGLIPQDAKRLNSASLINLVYLRSPCHVIEHCSSQFTKINIVKIN